MDLPPTHRHVATPSFIETLTRAPGHPLSLDLPSAMPRNAPYAELHALPQMLWIGNSQGDAEFVNQAWRTFAGSTSDVPHWLDHLHPEDVPQAQPLWQRSLGTGEVFQGEYRLRQHDGTYRWLLLEGRFQKQTDQGTGCWYLLACDVHARVQAQQALALSVEMQKNMLDASIDCIKIVRTDGTLVHMNQSGCQALGVDPQSGFGQRWLPLLPEEVRDKGARALQQAVAGENARFAGMSVIPGKSPMHWDNILTPVKDPQGRTSSILCVSRDITLQRQAELRLRQASEQDALTGLANRRAFNRKLKRLLHQARNQQSVIGLLLIDLDYFKHVNDTLGHAAGDHLLRVLSRRLRQCMPDNGFVARLGGDEFAVVLGPLQDAQSVQGVARHVLAQMDAPITYGGQPINGGMSIGCALFPSDARDASALMKCADTALNDLKSVGRGGIRMFDAGMLQAAEQVTQQLALARQIVRDGAVTPHYQPKVRLRDGCIVGFEALLRWRDTQGRMQSPAGVVAAFKDYEHATRIGEAMRARVLADIANWQQQGLPLVPIALNAAPVEFLRDDYAENLLSDLQTYQLSTQWIQVEITEHVMTDRSADYVNRALRLLKAAGVRIALDDFGTGHSSLAHLRDYPVDCLKIDYDFVRRIEQDPTIWAIVRAVGQLGPDLQLDLVAEGVETEGQRQLLLQAGYEICQGFLFGKAVPASEAAHLLGQQAIALP